VLENILNADINSGKVADWQSRKSLILVLIILGAVLLIWSCKDKPIRTGDAGEYIHMAQSLSNHDSAVLLQEDIDDVKVQLKDAEIDLFGGPKSGYFSDNFGKLYSYHFWLYSLISLPARAITGILDLPDISSFQIANAILFILGLIIFCLFAEFNKTKLWLYVIAIITGPAIFYLPWIHPEIFSFSFVLASVGLYSGKRYFAAAFMAAIASTQNNPIAFMAAFYAAMGLLPIIKNRRFEIKRLILASISLLPALFSPLFYYYHFGSFNVAVKVGIIDPGDLSIHKLFDLFFDLNSGLIMFSLISVYLFIVALLETVVGAVVSKFKEVKAEKLFFALVLLWILFSTTSQRNWNNGSEGAIRYLVWAYPLLLYMPFSIKNSILWRKSYYKLTTATLVITILLFAYNVKYRAFYVQHSFAAKYALMYAPWLYSPSPDIFAERTLNREVSLDLSDAHPAIHKVFTQCTKAFVAAEDYDKLLASCGYVPMSKQKFKQKFQQTGYINYGYEGPFFARQTISYGPMNSDSFKVRIYPRYDNFEKLVMYSDAETVIPLVIENTSTHNWRVLGHYGIRLVYSIVQCGQPLSIKTNDGFTYPPYDIKGGQKVNINIPLKTPSRPGCYTYKFDLVQDNVAWFSDRGNETLSIDIAVIQRSESN
jgi:hypothetical protein